MRPDVFADRRAAGRALADRVAELDLDDPLVLGLPRGGVPVAAEVAARLDAPLDVLVVRKIGAPHHPEYGIGAIGEGGVRLLDDQALQRLHVTPDDLEPTIAREREELRRRVERYRGGQGGADVRGRTVVVVDDGLATGVSASAAVRVLRAREAGRIVFAVPVGAPEGVQRLRDLADEVVALSTPAGFGAVGSFYHDFHQVTDEEVVELLAASDRSVPEPRTET